MTREQTKELAQLPLRIAIGMLKQHAKKALGENAAGAVADAVFARGEESGVRQLDEWLAGPAAKKEFRRLVNRAERCFAESTADAQIRRRIVSTGLNADAALFAAVDTLPEEGDDARVRNALLRAVKRSMPAASPEAAEQAVDEYLGCLRRSLLTLKDKGPTVVGHAVLRIETALAGVGEAVLRTERKLDAFIFESRRLVVASIADHIVDFSSYITDKTENFVGRRFVFDAVDQYLNDSESGYFVIRGVPGIGKSAALAKLVGDRGYAHHFNIAAEGIVSHGQFYRNAAAQIIARFRLAHTMLPARADEGPSFLKELLTEAVAASGGAKVVLVVDALDEAETPPDPRTNPLRLPESLPPGAFVVTSTRPRREGLELHVKSFRVLELEADGEGNFEDIESYIKLFAERPAMRDRIAELALSPGAFVTKLRELSEGNFMYLRHVLPAIEAGAFRDGGVAQLPQGLVGYYRRHWEQMRGEDAAAFARNRKVVGVLATARQPVSAAFVERVTGLSIDDVRWTLDNWREFLQPSAHGGELRHRIYHASYRDFLAHQVVS